MEEAGYAGTACELSQDSRHLVDLDGASLLNVFSLMDVRQASGHVC